MSYGQTANFSPARLAALLKAVPMSATGRWAGAFGGRCKGCPPRSNPLRLTRSCPLRMRSLALQIRTTKVPERS